MPHLSPTALTTDEERLILRATHDLYLAPRFARRVSPPTTTVYTHPSDQEMAGRVRGLKC